MANARSIEVFKGLREAQQKLDYFMLGLTSALFAYVGGQYEPMPINFSQNSIELLSLALFFISILSGFQRLETNITVMKLNFRKLDMSEKKGAIVKALSIHGNVLNTETGKQFNKKSASKTLNIIETELPKIETDLIKYSNYSAWAFDIRNWSLILGFMALGFSKAVGVYAAS